MLSHISEPLLEAIADAILILDDESNVVYANGPARAHFDTGGSLDIRSTDGSPIVPGDWPLSARDVLLGRSRERFRLQPNAIAGEKRVAITLTPLRDSETEARLRAAVDLAELASYEWDPKTNTHYWDARLRKIWGAPPEAAIDRDLFLRGIHPDDRDVQERIDASVDPHGPGSYDAEYRVIALDSGVERWVSTRGQTFFDEWGPVRFVGVARDITQQKHDEEELRSSHQRMQMAMEMARMFAWETDAVTGDFVLFDDPSRILNFDLPKSRSERVKLRHPDDRERIAKDFDRLLRHETDRFDSEHRLINPVAGNVEWVHVVGVLHPDGKRVIGMTQNITDAKQIEMALRVSEEQMRVVMRAARMYSWSIDPETLLMTYSPNVVDVLHYTPESTEDGRFKAVHPDDLPSLRRMYARFLRRETSRFNADYRFIDPETGKVVWLHGQGDLLRDENGKPERIIGVTQDVTALKEAERQLESKVAERTAELRKSNETIRALIDSSLIAIITVNQANDVETWNAEAEEIFGWRADEVIGRSMPKIADGSLDKAARQVLAGAAAKPFDAIYARKDARRVDVNVSLAPLRDADGTVHSYIAIMKDIGDRKRLEREREGLLRRIVETQEAEGRHIARELHDEMGQHLTSLKMGIDALHHERPSALTEQLRAVVARIDRGINRLAGKLRPGDLEDVGLASAAVTLASQFSRESDIAVDVHAEALQKERLPGGIETMLYRMLQEALTNVWKHSKATTVSVIFNRDQDGVQMIVEDTGRGFDVESLAGNHARNRFGLLGMRERATLAGGTFDVESTPGKGTSLFVRVPIS